MVEAEAETETGEEEDDSEEVKKLSAQIERVFISMGLSRFSSRIALQYLVSRFKRPGGFERLRRVVDYLLDTLNRTPRSKMTETSSPSSSSSSAASPSTPAVVPPPQAAAATATATATDSTTEPPAGDKQVVRNWQEGCPNIVRGLRAHPIWNTDEFPWIKALEALYPVIALELDGLQGKSAFQPYRAPRKSGTSGDGEAIVFEEDSLGSFATDCGNWNVCYLQLHGIDFEDNLAKCPQTLAAIQAIPHHYRHAFFSALAPNTHVYKHHGPTNKKLRCHLPLRVPPGGTAWLRVADQVIHLEEGKAVVFDDSFEHEASNDHPTTPRVVLVVDVWHPSFSDEEVKFFEFIDKMQIAAAKKIGISNAELGKDGDTFLSVIERARQAAATVDDSTIWGRKDGAI